MSPVLAELLEEIDLALAQRALAPKPPLARRFELRRERDLCWLRTSLAQTGQAATDADLEAALHGRPGRFVPGSAAHRLLRGLRAGIDQIEKAAEQGEAPQSQMLRSLAGELGAELLASDAELRACCGLCTQLLRDADRAHPIAVAAQFARSLRQLLSGGEGAAPLIQLSACQLLFAQGYPPVWLFPGELSGWLELRDAADADVAFARSVRAALPFHHAS